jgi:hypothetical protein
MAAFKDFNGSIRNPRKAGQGRDSTLKLLQRTHTTGDNQTATTLSLLASYLGLQSRDLRLQHLFGSDSV